MPVTILRAHFLKGNCYIAPSPAAIGLCAAARSTSLATRSGWASSPRYWSDARPFASTRQNGRK